MHYIVFDLEWNQGKLGKKDRHHEQIPFEIIEIGAVKLDENKAPIDRFQELIKPKVYRDMPQIIERMLHVNMKQLSQCRPFVSVCGDFLNWCGEDAVFCTWGNQDLLELQRNMQYFRMEPLEMGPFAYLDVQKLFSIDCEDGKSRRNLEYAIDFLRIEKKEEFHRASADAYYTAKVFEQLEKDVEQYCSYDVFTLPKTPEQEIHKIFPGYSKYISRSFPNKAAAMADKEVSSMRCYICDKNVRKKVRWFSPTGRFFIGVSQCPVHGYIKHKVRLRNHALSSSGSDNVYVDKTQKLIDEQKLSVIMEKRDKVLEAQKKYQPVKRKTRKTKKDQPKD
ncbi:MAG: exonuclease domain-containing protein [Lachnospiraceae bacterium]|nr:exonuclease domain-containing protein [Lachnospiraceae bacterium]